MYGTRVAANEPSATPMNRPCKSPRINYQLYSVRENGCIPIPWKDTGQGGNACNADVSSTN